MALADFDLWIFLLRLAFVGLLYLFLTQVVLALRRDLRQAAEGQSQGAPAIGRLAVVESGVPELVAGQVIDLMPSTTIGRGGHNAIKLNDTFASASHAVLSFRDKQWWLEDVGSTNGTLVNRKPVREATAVAPGDIIEIGRVKFKLVR